MITGACILVLIPVILHFANLTDTAHGYLGWMLAMSSYYVIGKSINSMIVAGIFPAEGGDTRFDSGAMSSPCGALQSRLDLSQHLC